MTYKEQIEAALTDAESRIQEAKRHNEQPYNDYYLLDDATTPEEVLRLIAAIQAGLECLERPQGRENHYKAIAEALKGKK